MVTWSTEPPSETIFLESIIKTTIKKADDCNQSNTNEIISETTPISVETTTSKPSTQETTTDAPDIEQSKKKICKPADASAMTSDCEIECLNVS